MPSTEITFCDRCNASIPEAAILDGTAVIRNGRGYCNACAQTFRDGSFEDELHFCDSCNVSLSVGEIRDGQAFFKEGKLLCRRCHAATGQDGIATPPVDATAADAAAFAEDEIVTFESVSEPPRTESRRREGRSVRIAFALVFLAVAVTLSVLLIQSPEMFGLGDPSDRSGSANRSSDTFASSDVGRVGKVGATRGSKDAIPSGPSTDVTSETPEPAGFSVDRETIESLRGSLREIEDRLATLETIARSTDPNLAGRMETLETSIHELRSDSVDSFEGVRTELAALRDVIRDVGSTVDVSTSRGDADPAAGFTEGEGEANSDEKDAGDVVPVEPVDPALAGILEKLQSPEAGQRFAALVELGRRGDVEHLPVIAEVLLEDEDFVVREFAANVLGTFGSKKAVEYLVQSLRDSAPSVVFAADEALQRITRKDFGMKRRSSSGARAEVVRRWESWWEKSGDDFR